MIIIMIALLLSTTNAIFCTDTCGFDGDHYCYLGQCYSCEPFRKNWEAQVQDFGIAIGNGNGVPAFSCQNDTQHISELQHYLLPSETGFNSTVYVGLRYQCVHYARLYWIRKYGAAFGNVDSADQIFKLTQAIDYKNGGYKNIIKFKNGGIERPQPGDLLIWNKSNPYFPYGHVAVVLSVSLDTSTPYVTIGEQNYDDVWDSYTYSRKLQVKKNNFGLTYIINSRDIEGLHPQEKCKDYNGSADDAIIGWVRLI